MARAEAQRRDTAGCDRGMRAVCCHWSLQGQDVRSSHGSKGAAAPNTTLHTSLGIQWVFVEAGRQDVREGKKKTFLTCGQEQMHAHKSVQTAEDFSKPGHSAHKEASHHVHPMVQEEWAVDLSFQRGDQH